MPFQRAIPVGLRLGPPRHRVSRRRADGRPGQTFSSPLRAGLCPSDAEAAGQIAVERRLSLTVRGADPQSLHPALRPRPRPMYSAQPVPFGCPTVALERAKRHRRAIRPFSRLGYHLAVTGTGQSLMFTTRRSPSTVASAGTAQAELQSSHTDMAGVIEPGPRA